MKSKKIENASFFLYVVTLKTLQDFYFILWGIKMYFCLSRPRPVARVQGKLKGVKRMTSEREGVYWNSELGFYGLFLHYLDSICKTASHIYSAFMGLGKGIFLPLHLTGYKKVSPFSRLMNYRWGRSVRPEFHPSFSPLAMQVQNLLKFVWGSLID